MMKIAAAQSGLGPPSLSPRACPRRERAAQEARRGKVRHVLHGWRILLAPLVAQVLERSGAASAQVPADYALSAYRRRLAEPSAPQLMRDI